VIGPSNIPPPDNIQHSQEIDIHAPGEIRTRDPSNRTAEDPRLRARGHFLNVLIGPLISATNFKDDLLIYAYFVNK
jgi:hypothetical protein